MRFHPYVFCALAFILGGCESLGGTARAAEPPVIEDALHAFRVVTVADGLQQPWSIAFLPSGDMLVTEKPGRLRIVRGGVLQPGHIGGVPQVRYRGQGGLLEVALHPDFESNQLLYLSYAKPSADEREGTTAVIRGRFDGENLTGVEEVFEAKAWSDRGAHFAGKLAFDEQGYLFITVGDRGVNPQSMPLHEHPAQNLMSHQGKVIRLHDDGRVPADNPFVGRDDALPEIWSYGHRNPQGLAIHPETGDVWVTEHGPQGGDELNLARPGLNYGWPVIGYGVQYGGSRFHEATHREGMEQPVQYWVPSIATSGLMIYTGDRFPGWRGHFFVGGLHGQQLARIPIAAGAEGRVEQPPMLRGFGRIREVREDLDGFIYLAVDGNSRTKILRLEPADAR